MVSFHRVSVFSYLIIKRIYSTFRFKRGTMFSLSNRGIAKRPTTINSPPHALLYSIFPLPGWIQASMSVLWLHYPVLKILANFVKRIKQKRFDNKYSYRCSNEEMCLITAKVSNKYKESKEILQIMMTKKSPLQVAMGIDSVLWGVVALWPVVSLLDLITR